MGTQARRPSLTAQEEGHRGRRKDPGLGAAQRKGKRPEAGSRLARPWGPARRPAQRWGEYYGVEECSQFGLVEG